MYGFFLSLSNARIHSRQHPYSCLVLFGLVLLMNTIRNDYSLICILLICMLLICISHMIYCAALHS